MVRFPDVHRAGQFTEVVNASLLQILFIYSQNPGSRRTGSNLICAFIINIYTCFIRVEPPFIQLNPLRTAVFNLQRNAILLTVLISAGLRTDKLNLHLVIIIQHRICLCVRGNR